VGGAVGPLAPPKAPLRTVGGALQCTVGGSLNIPHSRPEVDKELLFSVTGQVVEV